jgi:hypothetical protein
LILRKQAIILGNLRWRADPESGATCGALRWLPWRARYGELFPCETSVPSDLSSLSNDFGSAEFLFAINEEAAKQLVG